MTFNPVPKPKNYCRCGCGEEIPANRKWVSGHNLKRRPKDAIVKKGRRYFEIECDRCRKTFLKRSDQINRRSKKNYCSNGCANKANGKKREGKPLYSSRSGEYRKCLHCKNDFYVNRYRIENENTQYCSKECYIKRLKERGIVPENFIKSINNKGKNNGMYKNGKYVRNGRPSKKKLRNRITKRDGGNWCLFCGKPGPGLHLHRIKYGAQGGKYELDNCVQLCAEDHGLVHSNKRIWKPFLEKYIKTGDIDRSYIRKFKDEYDE